MTDLEAKYKAMFASAAAVVVVDVENDQPAERPARARSSKRPAWRAAVYAKVKAERLARNAGRPGEVRLRDWLLGEAARSGLSLTTVKCYHAVGKYRKRLKLRTVSAQVKWVTPVPGAPPTEYPGRGYGKSVRVRSRDRARLAKGGRE